MEKSVKYFEKLVASVPYPMFPDVGPRPERKNYESDRGYLYAVADWELAKTEARDKLKEERKAYDARMREIEGEFLDWAIEECGLCRLSDKAQTMVKGYALYEWRSIGGFNEVFLALSDLSDLLLAVYEDGKEAVK